MSIYGLFFDTKKLANGPSNQAKPHHYKNKQKTIADKNNSRQKQQRTKAWSTDYLHSTNLSLKAWPFNGVLINTAIVRISINAEFITA